MEITAKKGSNVRQLLECWSPATALTISTKETDGSWVRLKITIYDRNAPGSGEMQWIFMDGTPQP